MKFLVLLPLFAALLVTSCGEKSSSESSDSTGASAEPSADATQETEKPLTHPLSDADIERLLKEAVDAESLPERDGLIYHDNKPYSGWGKGMHYDSSQAAQLAYIKDGKPDGPSIEWYQNGQKRGEGSYKKGKPDGPFIEWHKNGQKAAQGTFKDGEEVSVKYWNSKGEEVETREEAFE